MRLATVLTFPGWLSLPRNDENRLVSRPVRTIRSIPMSAHSMRSADTSVSASGLVPEQSTEQPSRSEIRTSAGGLRRRLRLQMNSRFLADHSYWTMPVGTWHWMIRDVPNLPETPRNSMQGLSLSRGRRPYHAQKEIYSSKTEAVIALRL